MKRIFRGTGRMVTAACAIALASSVVSASSFVSVDIAASAHVGPNVWTSGVRNDNGAIIYSQNGGLWETTPLTPGATTVSAWASQSGNGGQIAYIEALASLDTGALRAKNISTGPRTFGTPLGIGTARWSEVVTFFNNTPGDLVLPFSWAIDGSFFLPGYAHITGVLSITNLNGLSSARLIGPDPNFGLVTIIDPAWGGILNQTLFGNVVLPFGAGTTWDLTDISNNATVGSLAKSAIVIPSGKHEVVIGGRLELDCRDGASCDFSHTAKFRFGDNPAGLTWTSESGVFLSAVNNSAAVPEPGTVALLGFGLTALAFRRYRQTR